MSASALAIRPGMGRIVAITTLGPFFGVAVILAGLTLIGAQWYSAQQLSALFGLLLFLGYPAGLVLSLIAAVAYTYFYPVFTSRWRQVVGCLVIGALTGGIGVLVASSMTNGLFIDPVLIAVGAAVGAFALPIPALAFSRRP